MADNLEGATDDVIDDEAGDAFNDEELVDAIEDAIDEVDGDPTDPEDEEVPGVTDDDVLDDDDDPAVAIAPDGVDRGDGRDNKGKFASRAEQDAADQATAAAKAAGKSPAEQTAAATAAAAAAKPAGAAAAAAPTWEPLSIRANKAIVPIDEARTTIVKDAAGNEHVLISVPKADFNRFQHRIGRGVAAEQKWRDIQTRERELELERAAPKAPSDAEIEAKHMLDAVKPYLADLFTPEALENLELKIKLAQHEAKQTFAASEATRRQEASAGDEWDRLQVNTIVDDAFDMIENHPELQGMSPETVKEVLADLAMPIRNQLVYKENGEGFKNTELLFKILKRAHHGAPTPAAAPAKPVTPAASAAPSKDERFNQGQSTAAQPRSTSLKANRGKPAPAQRRTSRAPVPAAQQRTERQIAEDDYNRTKRRQLSSDSFDDGDDD